MEARSVEYSGTRYETATSHSVGITSHIRPRSGMSTLTRRLPLLFHHTCQYISRASTSLLAQQYRRSHASASGQCIAHVPNRALLSVTGSHAATFLNGITTVQIPDPTSDAWNQRGRAAYSAFLSAQVSRHTAIHKHLTDLRYCHSI